MYRLHIDIPMPFTEEEARKASEFVVNLLVNRILIEKFNVTDINYRLGHDEDRQKSNYFMKNENGHVNNKKSKIVIQDVIDDANHNNKEFLQDLG